MGISRRRLFGLGATSAASVLLGTGAVASAKPFAAPARLGDPFTLGVASGDPLPDGIVLWTRLAPDPFAPDGAGGMPSPPVTVEYQVALDETFARVVRSGSVVATSALAHSVHPEITGLDPDTVYYYRFRAGRSISPTGRTRTAPTVGAENRRVDFAFASCQAWHDGYYTAYRHMADEDLDFVVHLGDYIYEYGLTGNKRGEKVEQVFGGKVRTLDRYRLQYAKYKSEWPLQQAHANFPWIVTFDDHEVEDDWAADRPRLDFDIDQLPGVFRRRRADAFQAMYEHQPLRIDQLPNGPNLRIHRRFGFGNLLDLTMLDTRQYRGGGSILGAAQRDWLLTGMRTTSARWQVLGNQVPMGRTDLAAGPDLDVSADAWDGFVADRNAVLDQAGARNVVVITGDRHQNYAADLRRDADSAVVATEFVGTSITSGGDGADLTHIGRTVLDANPDIKFVNEQRGYVRASVTQHLWRTDFRVVPYVERPGGPISTRATYVVEHASPGPVSA